MRRKDGMEFINEAMVGMVEARQEDTQELYGWTLDRERKRYSWDFQKFVGQCLLEHSEEI